ELRIDPVSAQETIEHLISLGYLDASTADSDSGPRTAIEEAELNLAIVHLNSMRPANAIPILERLVRAHPENIRHTLTLASAYGRSERPHDGMRILKDLESRGVRGPELDTMMGAALFDTGDLDSALAHLESAQKLAPEAAFIDFSIAKIYIARSQ